MLRHWGVFVAMAVHVCLATWFAVIVPPQAAPDEAGHMAYAHHLALNGSLPILPSSKDAKEWEFEYHQPPLAYLAMAAVMKWNSDVESFNPESVYQVKNGRRLIYPRLTSVLFGLATVVLVYMTAGKLSNCSSVIAGLTAITVAAWPLHAFNNSYISNDPLAEMLFTAGLLVSVLLVLEGLCWKRATFLGFICGLGALTKVVCLLMIPIALGAIVWAYHGRHGRWGEGSGGHGQVARATKTLWKAIMGFGVAFLVLAGPWFVRNITVYGDPLAITAFQDFFLNVEPHRYTAQEFAQGLGPVKYLEMLATYTSKSALGVFGHMDVWLPEWMYTGFGLLVLAAMIGWILPPPEQKDASFGRARALLWITFGLVLTYYLYFNTQYFQAQARYLLPGAAAIVFWLAVGFCRLVRRVHPALSFLLPLYLCACSLHALVYYQSLARHM